MNERTLQKWVWGRLAQFTFEVSGHADTDDIDDDPNSEGVSMLEVIIRDDSPTKAQEMLLDNFMPVQGKGFIFQLVERKWDESRQWFNVSMWLLLSYVVCLTIITVRLPSLEEDGPDRKGKGFFLSESSARTLISLILLFSFLLVMEEVRFVYLWCARRPQNPTLAPTALQGAACQLSLDHDVAGGRATSGRSWSSRKRRQASGYPAHGLSSSTICCANRGTFSFDSRRLPPRLRPPVCCCLRVILTRWRCAGVRRACSACSQSRARLHGSSSFRGFSCGGGRWGSTLSWWSGCYSKMLSTT